jgi:ADP-dependent phosphofructokinase/glucokinase
LRLQVAAETEAKASAEAARLEAIHVHTSCHYILLPHHVVHPCFRSNLRLQVAAETEAKASAEAAMLEAAAKAAEQDAARYERKQKQLQEKLAKAAQEGEQLAQQKAELAVGTVLQLASRTQSVRHCVQLLRL